MEIYDAENQILGRFCSVVAKRLIEGENVIVVNAEKAVISGSRKYNIEHYHERLVRGDPHKGPFFPRAPDGIVRRAFRGMLPQKKAKGRDAYKKLKVYVGIPEELKDRTEEFKRIKSADADRLKSKSMAIGDLSIALGTEKRW